MSDGARVRRGQGKIVEWNKVRKLDQRIKTEGGRGCVSVGKRTGGASLIWRRKPFLKIAL